MLNVELNPICHFLALLGAHHIFHVSRIRVNAGTSQTVAKSVKEYVRVSFTNLIRKFRRQQHVMLNCILRANYIYGVCVKLKYNF